MTLIDEVDCMSPEAVRQRLLVAWNRMPMMGYHKKSDRVRPITELYSGAYVAVPRRPGVVALVRVDYSRPLTPKRKSRIRERDAFRILLNACTDCGARKNLDRHHDWDARPITVRVLCEDCHDKADKEMYARLNGQCAVDGTQGGGGRYPATMPGAGDVRANQEAARGLVALPGSTPGTVRPSPYFRRRVAKWLHRFANRVRWVANLIDVAASRMHRRAARGQRS